MNNAYLLSVTFLSCNCLGLTVFRVIDYLHTVGLRGGDNIVKHSHHYHYQNEDKVAMNVLYLWSIGTEDCSFSSSCLDEIMMGNADSIILASD